MEAREGGGPRTLFLVCVHDFLILFTAPTLLGDRATATRGDRLCRRHDSRFARIRLTSDQLALLCGPLLRTCIGCLCLPLVRRRLAGLQLGAPEGARSLGSGLAGASELSPKRRDPLLVLFRQRCGLIRQRRIRITSL